MTKNTDTTVNFKNLIKKLLESKAGFVTKIEFLRFIITHDDDQNIFIKTNY